LRVRHVIWLLVMFALLASIGNSKAISDALENHSASNNSTHQNQSSLIGPQSQSAQGFEDATVYRQNAEFNLLGVLKDYSFLIPYLLLFVAILTLYGTYRFVWVSNRKRDQTPLESPPKVVPPDLTKKTIKILYPPNPNFTGRETLLNELRSALTSGKNAALVQSQVVTGLGGMGKTQLALAYTYLHLNDYSVIWWIKSEEPTSLAADYAELAKELDLKRVSEDLDTQIKVVKQWLETNPGWLLVFDNAQKPSDLDKYLPKIGSGHVIITSRNSFWENLANVLDVPVFERVESIEFLFKRTDCSDREAADALADAVGDLPLALEQAGAYIKETGYSFNNYLKLFQERRKEILTLKKPINYPEPVATT